MYEGPGFRETRIESGLERHRYVAGSVLAISPLVTHSVHSPEQPGREFRLWLYDLAVLIDRGLDRKDGKDVCDGQPQNVVGEVSASADPPPEPECFYGIGHIISERAVSLEEPLGLEWVRVWEETLVMQHGPDQYG